MKGLLRTELTRYRARPAIAALLLVVVLAGVVVAAFTAWDTRPPSTDELSTAQAQASIDTNRADIDADLATCLKDPATYLGPGNTVQDCKDSLTPAAGSYLSRVPLDLRGTLHGNGIGLALLIAVLLIIAASVFVGADFSSGAISNQVLFAPSRTALWTAKAIAVGVWSFVVSTVVLSGFWLSLYLIASQRDVAHGSGVVDDIIWHVVRGVVFATAASVGAFSLTTLLRNSAATLGLLFAYAIGGEMMLALLPIDQLARWTLGTNVFGWLETRLEYFGGTSGCGLGNCGPHHIEHAAAGVYLLGLLLVSMAAGLLSFRRRDL